MIAIAVELLTRRYVASSFNDRTRPEWPPHPARLFSALVATASEEGGVPPPERRALEWLERQGPPRIRASDAEPRAVVTTYVPENTTRVLADWSRYEERLRVSRAALEAVEREADTAACRRAQKAVATAEANLDQRISTLIADDGSYSRKAGATANQLLPDHRGKQPLMLPSVSPHEPHVRYEWPESTPDAATSAVLDALARRLVRLGHSSSLVACRVLNEAANGDETGLATWIPAEEGGTMLRTVNEGQLTRLEHAFTQHHGVDPRVLPAQYQAYRREGDSKTTHPAQSVFGEWIVWREVAPTGRRLNLLLTRTEDVTRALRGALLHHAEDPPPTILSGHTPDGSPLEQPHIAFLPLADVVGRHASGALLGMAIVLPRSIGAEDRLAILRAIGRWERNGLALTLGRLGAMCVERVIDGDPRKTLDPRTWTRPARRWASVTPVALDRNPGDLNSSDPVQAAEATKRAEAIVVTSCERIGLPRPEWVQVMRRSLFDAAPAAKRFMPYPRNGHGIRRVCVHVEMVFAEPVEGSVTLGAGRYFGLGLCRPWRDRPASPRRTGRSGERNHG